MRNKIKKIGIIILWLLIWQMAAIFIDNTVLLAGPVEVAKTLAGLLLTADFYGICLASMGRILLGFCMSFLLGAALGAISYRFQFIREIAEPVLSVMKSIPVASFVVLLLIWQGAGNLSVWISFFVVFPNACISTRNGLEAVDPKLKEMADVYGIKGFKRVIYIYRPSLVLFLLSGMEISIGMAFKSGVAAEIIGVPDHSIGERIYMSKIYLDTSGLFAWTVALIAISFCVEKLILKGMGLLLMPIKTYKTDTNVTSGGGQVKESTDLKEEQGATAAWEEESETAIRLSHISKAFDGKNVLSDVNMEFQKGGRYLLMGASGSGKTTLLRILAGLEKADKGNISGEYYDTCVGDKKMPVTAYLFQEDRLLEKELTITNIMLTAKTAKGKTGIIEAAVKEILPKDCLNMPAWTLSGGMKRRCALARALFYEADNENAVCLLDEPFAGLDDETKERTAAFIKKYLKGRTLIVATHDEKDAELLGGSIWRIAD